MLFYEFYATYDCQASSLISSMQGDRRELWIEHIAEINMILGTHRMDEKCVLFVSHATKGRFDMFAVANQLNSITPGKIEGLMEYLLEEYGLIGIRVHGLVEITRDRIANLFDQCKQKKYITDANPLHDLKLDYIDNGVFEVREDMAALQKLSYKEALKQAKHIMADRSFLEELARIYSDQNDYRKFYGHPVHYRITAGTMEAAMKMIRLLVAALYANKRLICRRINRICNIEDNCYDESDLENVVQCARGGTLVIEGTRASTENLRYANSYDRVMKFITHILRKHQRYTLCIVVEVCNQTNSASFLADELKSDMDFIGLEEGVGNKQAALRYLTLLEKDSDLPHHTELELLDALGDKTSFRASDVHRAFKNLSRTVLKEKKYLAYKSTQTIMAAAAITASKSAYQKLSEMVGLSEQKAMVGKIIATFGIRKLKAEKGLPIKKMSLHMCFTGNPGSAKTSMARIMAEILSDEGILPSGQFIECGRADLVGQYVGHTAVQVRDKFQEARGGILFIDEAYALADYHKGSFGDEAIATIVQEMENHRDDVIVIFAGYPKKMEHFLERNEGLRSRIAFHLDFPDYMEDELVDILLFMAREQGYTLSQPILTKCHSILRKVCHQEDFGNGRYVRNLLEQAIMRQSERLWMKHKDGNLEPTELNTLIEADFEPISSAVETRIPIGFSTVI